MGIVCQAEVVGAAHRRQMTEQQDWQLLATAPRDGTPIEFKCSYGTAPWYGLMHWTENVSYRGEPGWEILKDMGSGGGGFVDGGASVTWRPYNGDVSSYVDPTGGMQNNPAYWRGAVASKYGLPLDHYEKKRPESLAATPKRRGFWSWLLGGD